MWERCYVFLSETVIVNETGRCDGCHKMNEVYNCITQKLLYRYCTRVAYMKNNCQGEGLMVAFARNLGDLPCAALDLHLRVIGRGDWARLPPASAKAVLRSTRWKGTVSTMRSDKKNQKNKSPKKKNKIQKIKNSKKWEKWKK